MTTTATPTTPKKRTPPKFKHEHKNHHQGGRSQDEEGSCRQDDRRDRGRLSVDGLILPSGVEALGFGTHDKYAVLFDTEGTTDFCLVSFFLCGVLPEMGGYVATLSDNGHTIRWSRPVDGFLFSMEHLKSVMRADYSDTHVQVRSFNKVTQTISKDRVEADANGLFWGKPQEIHLEKWCTGTVEAPLRPMRCRVARLVPLSPTWTQGGAGTINITR